MKVKNCFVSNSSSSSFVIIGFNFDEITKKEKMNIVENVIIFLDKEKELLKAKEEYDVDSKEYEEVIFYEIFDDIVCDDENEFIHAEEEDIFGYLLARNRDYDCSDIQEAEYTLSELQIKIEQLKKFSQDIEPKLMIGVMLT